MGTFQQSPTWTQANKESVFLVMGSLQRKKKKEVRNPVPAYCLRPGAFSAADVQIHPHCHINQAKNGRK